MAGKTGEEAQRGEVKVQKRGGDGDGQRESFTPGMDANRQKGEGKKDVGKGERVLRKST